MISVCGNGARYPQVLDGGAIDVTERRHTLYICVGVGDIGGQRLVVAEESALERVVFARAHHSGDIDIGVQLHVLVAVAGTIVDTIGKLVPVVGGVDEEGVGLCAGMILPT